MNTELFRKTHDFIQEQLDSTTNPCVACSFGKDSTVVLDIVRHIQPRIPVVYVEQFPVEQRKHGCPTGSKGVGLEYAVNPICLAWNLRQKRAR
jgi:hypothetical protein